MVSLATLIVLFKALYFYRKYSLPFIKCLEGLLEHKSLSHLLVSEVFTKLAPSVSHTHAN